MNQAMGIAFFILSRGCCGSLMLRHRPSYVFLMLRHRVQIIQKQIEAKDNNAAGFWLNALPEEPPQSFPQFRFYDVIRTNSNSKIDVFSFTVDVKPRTEEE